MAAFAFALYHSTLLPGLDFGDTASFQAAVGESAPTPRQAYPLYFAIGKLAAALTRTEPAVALNLASAVAGALGAGVLVWVASGLTGSLVAGAAGGLLLASSYTFWTQAIIAEVYALHLLLMGLVIGSVLWWDREPTRARLTVVFAVYALAFGNHLMSILLLPALMLYIASAPGGLRMLVSPKTLGLAVLCAAAGTSQYLWNAASLWQLPDADWTLPSFLRAFWFDVTKSDWRETMILTVHPAALKLRPAMYLFEIRQQIGLVGAVLAVVGSVALLRRRRLALLLFSAYVPAVVFAATYNVGDAHVFFLPSHQIAILFAAAGMSAALSLSNSAPAPVRAPLLAAMITAAIAYPLWRAWDAFPAVDRHDDRRPVSWLSAIVAGLDDRALLLGDVNWQLENGFDYYTRRLRPELNFVRSEGTLLTLPFLVRDNLDAGREIAATPVARDLTRTAYGDLFTFTPDTRVSAPALAMRLSRLPPGTPYVLGLLAPYPDLPFDRGELADAVKLLTAGTATLDRGPSYSVLAGRVGGRPLILRQAERPFREKFSFGALAIDVRMESWLPTDTIRRAGFGHVIVGRRHVLTLERGVSVVALSPEGVPVRAEYASGLFAPLPRFLVSFRRSEGDPSR